jgi:hypothetical protein
VPRIDISLPDNKVDEHHAQLLSACGDDSDGSGTDDGEDSQDEEVRASLLTRRTVTAIPRLEL